MAQPQATLDLQGFAPFMATMEAVAQLLAMRERQLADEVAVFQPPGQAVNTANDPFNVTNWARIGCCPWRQ